MDILDGIAAMRVGFIADGLEPPAVILLESHEQGIRFLQSVRQTKQWVYVAQDPAMGKPIEMADGSVWMEVPIMNVRVRWPANRFANSDGSWCYV